MCTTYTCARGYLHEHLRVFHKQCVHVYACICLHRHSFAFVCNTYTLKHMFVPTCAPLTCLCTHVCRGVCIYTRTKYIYTCIATHRGYFLLTIHGCPGHRISESYPMTTQGPQHLVSGPCQEPWENSRYRCSLHHSYCKAPPTLVVRASIDPAEPGLVKALSPCSWGESTVPTLRGCYSHGTLQSVWGGGGLL